MGYYTFYELSVEKGDPSLLESEEFKDIFLKITDYHLESLDNDTLKWHEYDENMLEISKLYPDTVFRLEGEGEDRDDSWKSYYCNGDSAESRATIVYPPVDISSIGNIKARCPELFI